MLESFVQFKSQTGREIDSIYADICNELSRGNSNNLAASLIRIEAEQMNIYAANLVGKTRQVAIEALIGQGYPEYLTAGAWVKILREIGRPEIQLCSMQELHGSTKSEHTGQPYSESSDAKYADQIKALESRRNIGIGAAAAGGAAGVVALVIPGWEALPVALLCAGCVVMICGSATAIKTQSQIETIKSKLEREQAQAQNAPSRVAERELVKKVTSLQAERNTKAISQWIDMVEQAVVKMAASGTV